MKRRDTDAFDTVSEDWQQSSGLGNSEGRLDNLPLTSVDVA